MHRQTQVKTGKSWFEDMRCRLLASSPAFAVLPEGSNERDQGEIGDRLQDLSARDRAVLAACMRRKGYVDDLVNAFAKFSSFLSMAPGTTVVDVGGGPFTAGLALAKMIGDEAKFRYFGIEQTDAMRALGAAIAREVKALGHLDPRTEIDFHASLDEMDFDPKPSEELIVFVLPYLLPGSPVDVGALVKDMAKARRRIGWGTAAVLYSNSERVVPKAIFSEFKNRMEDVGFRMIVKDSEISCESEGLRETRYAIFRQLSVANIPVSRS
jgi:SAM-dependent methyltransferase